MPALTSQRHYITTYKVLIKRTGSENINDIYNYIKNAPVKDTTKVSYLNAIISLKKLDDRLVKGNINVLKDYRDSLSFDIDDRRNENNTNERQSKAIQNITLDDLNKFVIKLNANKNDTKKNREKYILVHLMVKYPLRNDLQEIQITHNKQDLDDIENYLYIPSNKNNNAILSIKKFKTAGSNNINDIVIDLDNNITNDIRELLKDGRKYLFVDNKGNPLTSNAFTHRLNAIFKKEFNMPISSTIIRKIYLTNKYAPILKEMEQDSKIMGHSLDMQRRIYIQRQNGAPSVVNKQSNLKKSDSKNNNKNVSFEMDIKPTQTNNERLTTKNAYNKALPKSLKKNIDESKMILDSDTDVDSEDGILS